MHHFKSDLCVRKESCSMHYYSMVPARLGILQIVSANYHFTLNILFFLKVDSYCLLLLHKLSLLVTFKTMKLVLDNFDK